MSADLWLEGGDLHGCEDTSVNVTYNLTPMLRAAGLPPWKAFTGAPASESGGVFAKVAAALRADPDRFKVMNPPNGWGDYDGAVEAMERLAALCAEHPSCTIGTWL